MRFILGRLSLVKRYLNLLSIFEARKHVVAVVPEARALHAPFARLTVILVILKVGAPTFPFKEGLQLAGLEKLSQGRNLFFWFRSFFCIC
jgi:hypothetical protein